nr:MAG TPA: hypothetical protein [Caudoviricetes sp.]
MAIQTTENRQPYLYYIRPSADPGRIRCGRGAAMGWYISSKLRAKP